MCQFVKRSLLILTFSVPVNSFCDPLCSFPSNKHPWLVCAKGQGDAIWLKSKCNYVISQFVLWVPSDSIHDMFQQSVMTEHWHMWLKNQTDPPWVFPVLPMSQSGPDAVCKDAVRILICFVAAVKIWTLDIIWLLNQNVTLRSLCLN